MSADNGVYIARFPTATGEEFRVVECTNIEDADYGTETEQDEWRSWRFENAKVFNNKEDATTYAYKLESDLQVCEYGVSYLSFDRPLKLK